MACCSRAAPLILTHVNLLLFLYAGAGLVTAARLKWDPSLYIVVRELFPLEYKVTAVALCVGGVAHLLLGHLCAAALTVRRAAARRALFIMYAVAMVLLVVGELAWCTWTAFRVAEFLRSERAKSMAEGASLFEEFKKFLEEVSWVKVFNKVNLLIKEAEEDLRQRSTYVAGASVVLFWVLQPMAVVLALLAARVPGADAQRMRPRRRRSNSWATTTTTASVEKLMEHDAEKAPLRTAYKNGRIVIL
ncbi:hypothetical protein K1T71_001022 [Dendrolimus kikuchii]|uniref:Uncharacterized protein n=1 Tax=Dendrolimus kikuchii TaxID=765133 RepID=A0ACC1DI37_9NEOP|nr:hypothetical protein K1T71_001022 [Dendrolimus kikuchii]